MSLHHGLQPVPKRMPRQLSPAWRSPPLPQHSSVAVFPQTPRLRPHPVPYPRNSLPLVKKGSGKKLHVPWKKNRTDLQSCGHGPFPSGGRPECHPGRPGIPPGAFVIACGATGLFNPVKGGHFIPLVLEELYRRGHRNLHLLLFGNQEKSVDYPSPAQAPDSLRT